MPDDLKEQLLRRELNHGNINLFTRPITQNPDGTHSSLNSMSFGADGKEILVPGVDEHGGGLIDGNAAIEQFKRTGHYLGKFNSVPEADAYAKALHDEGASGYTTPPLASSRKSVEPDALYQVLMYLLQK